MENNLNNTTENALPKKKKVDFTLKDFFKKFKLNIEKRLLWNSLNALISGLLGGSAFAIGTTAFLSVSNKNVGSAIFSLGLLIIFAYGFGFYTSKIGYIFKSTKEQNLMLIPIWLGNLLGALAVGSLMNFTRSKISYTLTTRASQLCSQKLSDSIIGILILSVLCGALMFIATDNFKNAKNNIQKYGIVVLSSMVFLLCGFEHFVSNAFLFVVAGSFTVKAMWYLIIMTLGNTIGALIIPLSHSGVKLIQRMARK